TWSGIGTVASGSSATLTFTATVTQSGSFTNYAQVQTSNQLDPDSTPGDNSGRGNNGDPRSQDDNASAPYTVRTTDFGDAPASYPVTLSQDGARHIATGLTLGQTRDGENNGQPSA